ncbi:type II toxin-antitoxin system Phd/YefM family antitoxin [Caulobacter segnis]
MRVALAEAEGQLTELVRRAEAGEEIILTREGRAAVQLTPVLAAPAIDPADRLRRLQEISERGRAKAIPDGGVRSPQPRFPVR